MYKFMVILKRDLINIVKNPALMIYNTVFPVLLVLVMGLLTKDHYGAGDVTAYDYYGVAIMIFMAVNISVTASNSFMEKSLKQSNLRVMHTPIKLSYIYLAKILATFIFAVFSFSIVTLVLKYGLGVNFNGMAVSYLALIASLSFMASALGVMFCTIFKSEALSNKILSIMNMVFAFFGGTFFQLDNLGDVVRNISHISPVRWATESSFSLIYAQDQTSTYVLSLIFLAVGLVFIAGCKYFFKTEDYV